MTTVLYHGHRYRAAQVERRAAKTVMYHGTSADLLASILKHGLRADPGFRRFTLDSHDHDAELATYGGVYLTPWIVEAQRFAGKAVFRSGHDLLLLVVKVETRVESIVPDEDHFIALTDPIVGDMYRALAKQMGWVRASGLDWISREATGEVSTLDWVEPWVAALKRDEGNRNIVIDPPVLLRYRNDLADLLRLIVKYDAAKDYEARLHEYYDEADIPVDKSVARQQFVAALDRFSRKIQRLTDPQGKLSKSSRSLEDIGFSGANRIVGILQYNFTDDHQLVGTVQYGERNPETIATIKAMNPYQAAVWTNRVGQEIYRKQLAKQAGVSAVHREARVIHDITPEYLKVMQANDWVRVYHASGINSIDKEAGAQNMVFGIDALGDAKSSYHPDVPGGYHYRGLYVGPTLDSVSQFGRLVFEFTTKARNLHATDWSGHTEKRLHERFQEEHLHGIKQKCTDLFPDSFNPLLSCTLSAKAGDLVGVEPQALLVGIVPAQDILKVYHVGKEYTPEQFIKAFQSDLQYSQVLTPDPKSTRLSFDQYLDYIHQQYGKANYTEEQVTDSLTGHLVRDPERFRGLLQQLVPFSGPAVDKFIREFNQRYRDKIKAARDKLAARRSQQEFRPVGSQVQP